MYYIKHLSTDTTLPIGLIKNDTKSQQLYVIIRLQQMINMKNKSLNF